MLSDDFRWFSLKNSAIAVPEKKYLSFGSRESGGPHIMWPLYHDFSHKGPPGWWNVFTIGEALKVNQWLIGGLGPRWFGYFGIPGSERDCYQRGIPRLPNHRAPNLPLLEKSFQFSDTSSQWLPKITPKSHLVKLLLVTFLCFPFFWVVAVKQTWETPWEKMIPKRELRGFWSDARTKPPFFRWSRLRSLKICTKKTSLELFTAYIKYKKSSMKNSALEVGKSTRWVFPKIGLPQNGWLLKWMIWGYHYFRKHPDGLSIFHMFSMSSSLPKTSPVFLFDLLESYCKATKNQSEVTPLSKITYILYSDYIPPGSLT